MALYRREHLERRLPLRDVPTLAGHRPVAELPARGALYDEVFRDFAHDREPEP